MSKRFVALLAALAALALIVAGCGGGSSSTESTSSLSKAEFVKKGNAICAKNEKKIQKTFETFAEEHNFSEKNPPSEKELQELSGELLPVVRSQIDEIRALGIPQGDEKEVEAIFAAAEEGIEETEKNPSVISEPGGGPFKKANKLSRDYGLTTCGEEGEASGGE